MDEIVGHCIPPLTRLIGGRKWGIGLTKLEAEVVEAGEVDDEADDGGEA